MLQLTDFHVHQLLGDRVDVNYWYQEAFWYKICISKFTLSSALQHLLSPSAFNIRLPQLPQIIITFSPRRAKAK